MIVECILIFSITIASLFFFFGKWNGKEKPNHPYPPSLPSLPIVGSLPFLRNFQNIAEFFTEKSYELGPIFTFRVGGKLILTLNNKEVIEEALVRNSRSFSSRPDILMQKLGNPNSKGIAFMNFTPEYKRVHQSVMSILREFGFGVKNLMEEIILREVESMMEHARKKEGKSFDPKDLIFSMTSNIIMSITFGSRRSYDLGVSELTLELQRYLYHMDMIFDIVPFLKYIPPFSKKLSGVKDCSKRYCDIIEKEISKSLQNKKVCFVSEYIKNEGPNYDREQLNFLIRDLVAAATDTNAHAFRWALLVFVNHPEIQTRLQKDIDSVIPRDRLPTLEDQTKLPYVEATILELYRWRTAVPLAAAHRVDKDSVIKGFFIPEGTVVLPNLYAAHTHRDAWKDPDVFRPERFLDEEGNVIGRDRILSFSVGRRACSGENLARAEIFLLLTSFLKKFTTHSPEGQDKICDQFALPMNIVTMPRPFSIRLSERQ